MARKWDQWPLWLKYGVVISIVLFMISAFEGAGVGICYLEAQDSSAGNVIFQPGAICGVLAMFMSPLNGGILAFGYTFSQLDNLGIGLGDTTGDGDISVGTGLFLLIAAGVVTTAILGFIMGIFIGLILRLFAGPNDYDGSTIETIET